MTEAGRALGATRQRAAAKITIERVRRNRSNQQLGRAI
jgi:hypothetical protein